MVDDWISTSSFSAVQSYCYDLILKKTPFIPEKDIELSVPFVADAIHSRRWHKFFRPNLPPADDSSLVREFYAHLHHRPNRQAYSVYVRGLKVDFSPPVIRELYGLTNDDLHFNSLLDNVCARVSPGSDRAKVILDCVAVPNAKWNTESGTILVADLKFEAKVWFHIVRNRIVPSANDTECSSVQACFIYAIMNDMPIDVAFHISFNVFNSAHDALSCIGFPSLITELCRRAGIQPSAIQSTISPPLVLTDSDINHLKENQFNQGLSVNERFKTETEVSASGLQFIDVVAERHYINVVLKKKPFIPESYINLTAEVCPYVVSQIQRRDWHKFFQPQPTAPDDSLVREFYAHIPSGYRYIEFRGVHVKILPAAINEFYGLPRYDPDYLAEFDGMYYGDFDPSSDTAKKILECVAVKDTKWLTQSGTIAVTNLKVEAQVWLKIINNRIMPSANNTECSYQRVCCIYALMKDIPIDIGDKIFKNIRKSAMTAQSCIGFPSLITELCRRAGIQPLASESSSSYPLVLADSDVKHLKERDVAKANPEGRSSHKPKTKELAPKKRKAPLKAKVQTQKDQAIPTAPTLAIEMSVFPIAHHPSPLEREETLSLHRKVDQLIECDVAKPHPMGRSHKPNPAEPATKKAEAAPTVPIEMSTSPIAHHSSPPEREETLSLHQKVDHLKDHDVAKPHPLGHSHKPNPDEPATKKAKVVPTAPTVPIDMSASPIAHHSSPPEREETLSLHQKADHLKDHDVAKPHPLGHSHKPNPDEPATKKAKVVPTAPTVPIDMSASPVAHHSSPPEREETLSLHQKVDRLKDRDVAKPHPLSHSHKPNPDEPATKKAKVVPTAPTLPIEMSVSPIAYNPLSPERKDTLSLHQVSAEQQSMEHLIDVGFRQQNMESKMNLVLAGQNGDISLTKGKQERTEVEDKVSLLEKLLGSPGWLLLTKEEKQYILNIIIYRKEDAWIYENPETGEKIIIKDVVMLLNREEISTRVVDAWCNILINEANERMKQTQFRVYDCLLWTMIGNDNGVDNRLVKGVRRQLQSLTTERTLFFPINTHTATSDRPNHWTLLEFDIEHACWTHYNSLPHTSSPDETHMKQSERVRNFVQLCLHERAQQQENEWDFVYKKFEQIGATFTANDKEGSPRQEGPKDCAIICFMIMEKRLSVARVIDILHKADEYSMETCKEYWARIVKELLRRRVSSKASHNREPSLADLLASVPVHQRKIGQGTYSDVYRAREVETGRMVALKKVKFDNFEPESVRFMAREIMILRKLDHPNIMKLEGIITSRLSCHLYLVFEYMEHDLAGLLSCPDVKFTESQIKCYMKQLLSGVDYCHRRGIMHRDIKTSNVLINNEGVLKMADFGLANFLRPKNREPLTSRVVTLWYRPPELLLGSTNYGETVDLWSVGCVFAEIFLGRPLFKGRTEVEQLHKIFKLCGSPAEEFWKRSRLPLATMFRPQHPYESTLRERCREFPKSAVSLIETLLAIEPYNRETASSALDSEYFHSRPFACEPSSMPQYPPNKEMDAKYREDTRRRNITSRTQSGLKNTRQARKTSQESSDFCKVVPREENESNIHLAPRSRVATSNGNRRRRTTTMNPPLDTMSEASETTEVSNVTSTYSVPVLGTESMEMSAKRRKELDVFTRLHTHHTRRRKIALEPSDILHVQDVSDSDAYANDDSSTRVHRIRREHSYLHQTDDLSNVNESQETSTGYGHRRQRSRDRFDINRQTGQASQRTSRFN